MALNRRKFERKYVAVRSYKKLFIISTEGQKTEPEYFEIFDNRNAIIKVKCLKSGKDSSPLRVLKRMEKYIKEESLLDTDEAWLVVDRDQWTEKQLSELNQWAEKKENHGFALSNPKFEFWLLLHFEDVKSVKTSKDCTAKLKKHIPDYDKSINPDKITDKMINDAITRAKSRDKGSFEDNLRSLGSTVYKVVEKIMERK